MRQAAVALAILLLAATVLAGGSAESAVLVVDPSHPDSLRVANHYVRVRGIPSSNVLTMTPDDPGGYVQTAARNVPAFLAEIRARGIDDRIDYVVLAPTARYRSAAAGLLSDSCSTVRNFAVPSAYTLAFIADEVLAGDRWSTESNRFYSTSREPMAFRSATGWLSGQPSDSASARRYVIGALLGYTGNRGNTSSEILDMIDRSAAADGTRPAGTFYLMQTTDAARSGPRDPYFPATVAAIEAAGGAAEHLMAVLPEGAHDCLGVMTGLASPDIPGGDFTLLPGSFCDHLTSYAGHFDTSSQVKMSAWIAKGASGTVGAVEEPCNYPGKFPRPEIHLHVLHGATLGEAWFRTAGYVPFQILFLGDPLARPFAHVPAVDVGRVPRKAVGRLRLRPGTATTHPTARIVRLDLLVDGRRVASTVPGGRLVVRAKDLVPGWHEVAVLAHDDSPLRTTGAWRGSFLARGRGKVTLQVAPVTAGDLATRFEFGVEAGPGDVTEVRLLKHGRVVAAAAESPAVLGVHGQVLGAGRSRLVAEALFADGRRARSGPVEVDVAADPGEPAGAPPTAFSYTKRVAAGVPNLVELPATHEESPADATYEVLTPPARAAVAAGTTAAFRIVTPAADAQGAEALTFRVTTAAGESGVATVTLVYGPAPADADLELLGGSITDDDRPRRDRVEISGRVPFPDGYDPRGAPVRVRVGGGEHPLFLYVGAGARWRDRRGELRTRVACGPKVKLRVAPETGDFHLSVRRADLPVTTTNPVRVSLAFGSLRAQAGADWVEDPERPGSFTFPGGGG